MHFYMIPQPRITSLALYLQEHWLYDNPDRLYSHGIQLLLKQWMAYIDGPKENFREFDSLKRNICNLLGEDVYNDVLNFTKFLHRTAYLQITGQADVISEDFIIPKTK